MFVDIMFYQLRQCHHYTRHSPRRQQRSARAATTAASAKALIAPFGDIATAGSGARPDERGLHRPLCRLRLHSWLTCDDGSRASASPERHALVIIGVIFGSIASTGSGARPDDGGLAYMAVMPIARARSADLR
jgi:hypothetical protein